jgi:hypothetical protein
VKLCGPAIARTTTKRFSIQIGEDLTLISQKMGGREGHPDGSFIVVESGYHERSRSRTRHKSGGYMPVWKTEFVGSEGSSVGPLFSQENTQFEEMGFTMRSRPVLESIY